MAASQAARESGSAPLPDLRRSLLLRDEAAFFSVVRGGALQERGMPRWDDILSTQDVDAIHAWLIAEQGALPFRVAR